MCKQKFDTLKFNFLQKIKYFVDLKQSDKEFYIKYQFKKAVGYDLNLSYPQTFNEKIQWYKLFYRNDLMTKCADKFLAREYIKEKLGEEYLIPLINVYNDPDKIDFDALPDQFVLKVNWGAGQNIIVPDKSKLDIKDAKKKLKKWMKKKHNHYFHSFEWAYKNIKPRIICEKFINEIDDVIDYKFFCYNGEPKNMFIVQYRKFGVDKMRFNFFDIDFNPLLFERYYKRTDDPIEKPELWDEMLKISRILAKDFPFVRVDFYQINNRLKIGELTFYPGNGMEPFTPQEWDYKFGDLFVLPTIEDNKRKG